MGEPGETVAASDAPPEPEPTPPAVPPIHRLRDLDGFQRAWVGAVVAFLVVAAAVLVHALRSRGYTPVSDEANQVHGAQLAFRTRPLVGDFNTANFYGNPPSHHPGPLAWYALAPWVDLLGPRYGAWLSAVASNTASTLVAGWLAFRAGGFRVGGVVLAGAIATYATAVPGGLASSFFQHVPLLPLLVCLVGCWAFGRGDAVAFPLAVVAGTYVVQAATLDLPLVACCGLAGTACAWRRLRRTGPTRRDLVLVGVGLLAGVVLWLPPLWDELFRSGNLSKLARAEIPHAGLGGAVDEVARLGHGGLWVPAVVALAICAALARRLGPVGRDPALVAVAVAAVVGTAITGSLIPADDVETTHHLWTPFVGLFLAALAGALLLPTRAPGGPRWTGVATRVVGCALTAVVLLGSLPNLWDPPRLSADDEDAMHAVGSLAGPVLDRIPAGPVQLAYRGAWGPSHVASALAPRLEDAGHDTSFGDAVAPTAATTLVVLRGRPTRWQEGEVIASYDPPDHPGVDDGFAAEVDRWARSHGPLVLDADLRFVLGNLLDGRAGTLCLDDVLADPDQLLDLGPDLAARLYAASLVTSPTLPPDLVGRLNPWQAELPVTVLRVDVPADHTGDLAFSEPSC